MAYIDDETSQSDSDIVELYKFETAQGDLTQTSADNPIVFNLDTYTPDPITRSIVQVGGTEDDPPTLTLTVSRTHPVALRYIQTIPPDRDVVIIYRGQLGGAVPDQDGRIQLPANQVIQYFEGFVSTVEFLDSEANITLVSDNSIFNRPFPRKNFRNLCNHLLYDGGCAVVQAPFDVSVTVTGIAGNIITLAGVPPLGAPTPVVGKTVDGPYYDGGLLTDPGTGDTRMVLELVRGASDDAQILFPFQTLGLGQVLTLTPGCDHTLTTCTQKFDNAPRYGGFPFVPTDNPFAKKLAD